MFWEEWYIFSFWDMINLTISIQPKKWKISQDQKKLYRPISMKFFLGRFQMILRKKNSNDFFFTHSFFYGRGAWAPRTQPPPGLRPWTLYGFGLRTLVGTGSRSTVFQQKTVTFFFLKIGWNVSKEFFIEIGRKLFLTIFENFSNI